MRIDGIIEGLEGPITELRPAALDQLGAQAAIEALIARMNDRNDVEISADFDLAWEKRPRGGPTQPGAGGDDVPPGPGGPHQRDQACRRKTARVALEESDGEVIITVEDDGSGFSEDRQAAGLRAAGYA